MPSLNKRNCCKGALNAMYNLELTREDVINIGKNILKAELDFNAKAGILQDMNGIPEFFRTESSEPTGLKFTFTKEELNQFWKKLN